MKVLIFEDELHIAQQLTDLLIRYDTGIEVIDIISSNKEGITWFENNEMPDLIFQDIELSDGNCFQLFEQTDIQAPTIFATAYSDYALRAFSQNSIDYLLKPYDFDDIKKALDKYKRFKDSFILPQQEILERILEPSKVKQRFLVKLGEFYRTVETKDISYFVSEEGLTAAYSFDDERYYIDYSLNQLNALLDSETFYQVNRKYILSISSIKEIKQWFNGRLKIELKNNHKTNIIVSRYRTQEFKKWLGY